MQDDLAHVLNEVEDPELHIGIVDMGMIYRADWSATGIEVEFTTTSAACPFAETMLQQINNILRHHFREATSIRVRLVRDPPWTVERLTDSARRQLGWPESGADPSGHFCVDVAPASWKH
jgi:metal-sulfur cluster biosynthetic enzyme